MMKKTTSSIFLLAFLFAINANSQNFSVTSGSIAQSSIDSCSSTTITINTYLGCINWVQGPSTYSVSGTTLNIDVNYTSSPICAGAISNPVFTQTVANLPPAVYSVDASAYIDNIKGNTVSLGSLTVTSCNVTGLSNSSVAEKFSVYPNPTSDFISVKNTTGSRQNFQLIDLSGREALIGTISPNTSKVDLTTLSPGIYFMKFTSKNEQIVQKIILQ